MRRGLFLLGLLLVSAPSFAAGDSKKKEEDDDDLPEPTVGPSGDDFEDDEDKGEKVKKLEEDAPEEEVNPEDEDFTDKDDGDLDFSDDEDAQDTVAPRGPGEDTAQLYRATQKKVAEMSPEEEQIVWEAYLQKYPKSLFRDRIEARMEELAAEMFGERVPGSTGEREGDAAQRELNFAVPKNLVPADPRQRISGGVELLWLGGKLDYEHPLTREWSVHGGVARDYTGGTLVAGTRYALLKSSRTGTILSGALDLKVNSAPAFVALQPTLVFGQRFDLLEGLDVTAEAGINGEFHTPPGVRYQGGVNATLRASEVVNFFAETTIAMKYLGSEDFEPFAFDVATVGLDFRAKKGDRSGDGRVDVGLAVNYPYTHQYWSFYRGAFRLSMDWYL